MKLLILFVAFAAIVAVVEWRTKRNGHNKQFFKKMHEDLEQTGEYQRETLGTIERLKRESPLHVRDVQ